MFVWLIKKFTKYVVLNSHSQNRGGKWSRKPRRGGTHRVQGWLLALTLVLKSKILVYTIKLWTISWLRWLERRFRACVFRIVIISGAVMPGPFSSTIFTFYWAGLLSCSFYWFSAKIRGLWRKRMRETVLATFDLTINTKLRNSNGTPFYSLDL